MQPLNPLISLGIAMIASSAIGVSAAMAEPGMHPQRSSTVEGETTSSSSASATSDAAGVDAISPSATVGSASVQAESSFESEAELPDWQSSLQKPQSLKAQISGEERLDQLQRDSFNRQRRSESQNDPFDRPLAPEPNPLQVEQEIQRQLNLPSPTSSDPASRLERLQDQQRLRQQLRQQRSLPAPPEPEPLPDLESQASLPTNLPTEATATETNEEQAALSELRPNKGESKLSSSQTEPTTETTETAQTEPDQREEAPSTAAAESEEEPSEADTAEASETAETDKPETSKTETAASDEQNTPVGEVDGEVDAVDTDAEDADVATDAAAEESNPNPESDEEAGNRVEAGKTKENLAQEPTETEEATEAETEVEAIEGVPDSSSDVPPALQDAPDPNEPPILREADEQRRNSRDVIEDQRVFSDDTSAPEYLDPDPNPLAFPTSPDEVEIAGTQPITLRQAVELALRNNAELRQAQLTLERTQAELRETQSANYPTASANAQFNQQGSESAQRQPETNILGQPNPEAGDINVTYGDSTTLGAGLQLDYTIFTSGRRPALIEAARGQVRLQQLEIERQVEQLIFETATNYYDLQEAGAQVNIFRANLEQAEQSLRDAQALERAGVGTRFDVLQAEVEVANARQDLTQQLSELEISRRELAQQLNISESLDIAAADPIEVSGVWDLSLEESIVQAYKNRVELEQSLIQREIAQRNRRAALAQLGPQIGFNGAFNVVNDVDNDFTFLHNYQLGLTVTQSLYDGGLARSQANQQESNIAIAESEFENRREQIRFEVERAYSQLDANFANIQTTALAVEQAAEALRLARLRFQAGVGTQTDVLRQQTELARSQVNNLSAILSYNRAIVALERAVSNYPEGYLNDVP